MKPEACGKVAGRVKATMTGATTGFRDPQGERHPTGGWHSLSKAFVTACGVWLVSEWACNPHSPECPVAFGVAAGTYQQSHEGMLQPRDALSKVGLPGQFSVGCLAFDVALLQSLHQQARFLSSWQA